MLERRTPEIDATHPKMYTARAQETAFGDEGH